MANRQHIVVLVLSAEGQRTAKRLRAALPEIEVHGLKGLCNDCDVSFDVPRSHIQQLFLSQVPVVGICPTALLIHAVADCLKDAALESPLIALSEDGQYAVPLLGGHSGANLLARQLAECLGGNDVITNAVGANFGVALDRPPKGWVLANPEAHKAFTASLIEGEHVSLRCGDLPWLKNTHFPLHAQGPLSLSATTRHLEGGPSHLVYHPKALVLGVSFAAQTSVDSLQTVAEQCLHKVSAAPQALALIAALDTLEDELSVLSLAANLAAPARYFETSTPSDEYIVGEAEALAMAHAAADGRPYRVLSKAEQSGQVACVCIELEAPLDAESVGRSRGELYVLGLTQAWQTQEGGSISSALSRCTDVLTHFSKAQLPKTLLDTKTLHCNIDIDALQRAQNALDLAVQGRRVALLCCDESHVVWVSRHVLRAQREANDTAYSRIHLEILPGQSRALAMAAEAGAPLGNNYLVVSVARWARDHALIIERIQAAQRLSLSLVLCNPTAFPIDVEVKSLCKHLLRHGRDWDTEVIVSDESALPRERLGCLMSLRALAQRWSNMPPHAAFILPPEGIHKRLRGDGYYWIETAD